MKWGPLQQGDLRNEADLRQAFENWRPLAVMHFAAYAYVGESNTEPLRYYENNVGGTAKLLQPAGISAQPTAFQRACPCERTTPETPSTPMDARSSSSSACSWRPRSPTVSSM